MTAISLRPWGVSRATECSPLDDSDVLALTAEDIDPVTQLGIYRDPTGQVVQAGPPKHGTQRAQFKSLPTGGGDGSKPGSGDDTKIVEYVPD
ncbi:putative ATP-grasp-modified RiPP [Kribbella kalugense]|uniref:Putative ATP-grasp target RiPP n=1 Tax=Kribbella kalugense TaxID=2512221 RepID=A0A4R7ZJZ2_9ACTN|nr:putative ATP-grasp-modified RiPP [Kribbella kalugense]TDW18099.1 putative ATP-grasp target RiPP [Kribbella kalugense]